MNGEVSTRGVVPHGRMMAHARSVLGPCGARTATISPCSSVAAASVLVVVPNFRPPGVPADRHVSSYAKGHDYLTADMGG